LESANSHEGDFIFVRQLFASFLFEQERFPGLEGEQGNTGGGAVFQRLRPEAGDIEAQMVIFPRDFDGNDGDRVALWTGRGTRLTPGD
jgi:hypothetical protein